VVLELTLLVLIGIMGVFFSDEWTYDDRNNLSLAAYALVAFGVLVCLVTFCIAVKTGEDGTVYD
jgi:protein-S-isoprenylcysteine O-methyltransferase Ste14